MSKTAGRLRLVCEETPRWGPRQEKAMNTRIQEIFEGLICLASAAVVLVGTLAICFPAPALPGA
jgi:hypothetical protein